MIVLNTVVLALVATGAWWLTGIDKTAGGESKRSRHFTRALRCVAVLFLAAVFIWFVEQPGMGFAGIPFLIIIPVSIALLLRSSVSELFTHGFLRFLDPALHDDRPLDPGKSRRYQDAIARLIQNGQRDEAIKLCEELKLSGEVDLVTLENTLEFLGVKQDRAQMPKPLAQAARLRAEGKFAEAEQRLKSLLAQNPADAGAAMMLMRLFTQDLRQPGKAHEILRQLEKQPHVSASHVEFARRSIDEWSRPMPEKTEVAAPPESVEELLAQGFLGTAIERLEEQIKAQPQDFALRLKLAEIHAVRCKDFQRAEKIIRQMETSSNFSPPQTESARAKLKEWRAAAGSQHGMA
jgi:thioredoxin-like negative regulator of GroEL